MLMRRKWFKRIVGLLLVPVFLFVLLMFSLYIPPVQNFLRKELIKYASEATGMQLGIKRIDLRFPLNLQIREVTLIQKTDTLLSLERLNVSVQMLPLFRGEVKVKELALNSTSFNSAGLLHGMKIKGVLGNLNLKSHDVNLADENALLGAVELSNTHIYLQLEKDTLPPEEAKKEPLRWKIALQMLKLHDVSFNLHMPEDSMRFGGHVSQAILEGTKIDFGRLSYTLQQFKLNGSSFYADLNSLKPNVGFDASHIAVRDVNVSVDSLLWQKNRLKAMIRQFSLNERSGLSITEASGSLVTKGTSLRIPLLKLLTPNSQVNFSGQTAWFVKDASQSPIYAKLDAFIGKQDVMLFAGNLPEAFRRDYPFRALRVEGGIEGSLKHLQLSRFKVELPGALSITGGGDFLNVTDSLKRSANLDLQAITGNLDFMASLHPMLREGTLAFPSGITLVAKGELKDARFRTLVRLKDGDGSLSLKADYDDHSKVYKGDVTIDSLQMKHFLPKDSLYTLSALAEISGRGLDFASSRSVANFRCSVNQLHYGRFTVSDIGLTGGLKNGTLKAVLTGDNQLFNLSANAEYHLNQPYTEGKLLLDVKQIDWYKLGYYPKPMKQPFAFTLNASAQKDSLKAVLQAHDLDFSCKSKGTLEHLIKQSKTFSEVLLAQLKNKRLDHSALRKALPTAGLMLNAGTANPLNRFLAIRNITYKRLALKFGTTPDRGINGRASVDGLVVDSIQLDSLFLNIKQDTTRITMRGGVINAPDNPQFVFKTYLTGEIRNEDAELMLEYQNEKEETGVLLGVNVKPRNNGIVFKFIPDEPIVAFRKFRFNEDNRIFLRKDRHIFANVEMLDKDGMGVRIHSLRDTTFLQNMDIELRRIRLAEISEALPYLPRFSGLLSAEGHYVQTATSLQLSTESNIDELVYENQRIGDVSLGVTWLPGEKGTHYVNSYLTHEGTEVMTLNGTYHSEGVGNLDVNGTLKHFPLSIANVFIPDQAVTLSGDLDGELILTGQTDKPVVNGKLMLDSVSVFARQAGARYWFDHRPVNIENSRVNFDKFAISTTSKNPFIIDGYVDFKKPLTPMANLSMKADNYTLLDAPRTNESLVYGKVFVDFNSTLRGPLNALVMRGNMNLLGNTNVTYVLRDSPLTVQDRLGELVTFTDFSDTLSRKKEDASTLSLGGLDMLMTVHIDPAVRLKADLTPDRSSYVSLEGGGDLSLQYSPRGDLVLSGRYTLSGGTLKYSLPIIPLKEFTVDEGSYVEWKGNPMEPTLNLKATERIRASVAEDENSTRMVNFDVSIAVQNELKELSLIFDLNAPEDGKVQSEIAAMSPEERSKQAVALLATGIYMANAGSKNSSLNMSAALNSMLQSQMSNVAGAALKTVNISLDMQNYDASDAGGQRTDYSFRYAQRFFNDRFQVVLGGTISTSKNRNQTESFIDDVSLEYRLDSSGTRYVRVFHKKNYESILEGEITETGVGLVLRKKMNNLGELFIFKRKK